MSDRYEILSKLGQGGIGAVYRALDTTLGREVAIKRLLPQGEKPEEARKTGEYLIREAGMLSQLQHPNVIHVFEAATDDDGAYIVMELVEGETLDKVVAQGQISRRDFVGIMEQALEALIAAQAIGMMHRDLKPTNIILKRQPSGKYDLKVLDFGLAKVSAQPALQTIDHGNSILGSIYFMAPEQFEHVPLDGRTDLYALGCLGYYGLSGEYPFRGETAALVMDAHLDHRVEDIRTLRPDLPDELGAWLMRMISLSVDDRPADARTALEELEGILAALPKDALGETRPVEKKPKLITGPAAMKATSESKLLTGPEHLPPRENTSTALRPPMKKKAAPPWLTPALVAAGILVAGIAGLAFINGSSAKTPDQPEEKEPLAAKIPPPRKYNWVTPEGHFYPHEMKQGSRPLARRKHGDYKWGAATPYAEVIPTGAKWTYMPPDWKSPAKNWKAVDFAAKGWKTGKAPIGISTGAIFDKGTRLDKHPAFPEGKKVGPLYLRNVFILESANQMGPLELFLRVDDAATVFLNGREVKRIGLPEGDITHFTPAIRNAHFFSGTPYVPVRFNGNNLRVGKNAIAIRVHARGVKEKDMDLGFDAALYLLPRGTRLDPKEDFSPLKKIKWLAKTSRQDPQTWKYSETVDPFTRWDGLHFTDSKWTEGPGPFGVVDPGAELQPRTPWKSENFYLRRRFNLSAEDLKAEEPLALAVKTNVSATIHVNGILAAELKKPVNRRYALVTLPESVRKKLVEGENVIAVHLGSTAEKRFFDLGLGSAPVPERP